MFDHRHYVPILKGKRGELDALAKAENISQFTALVEVVPIPLTYPDDGGDARPSKTIDRHIKDTAASFIQAMGILPSVFIDGFYIEGENKLNDGTSALAGLFSRLRAGGIKFVPTIGLDRIEDHADAVRDAIATDKRGCCLRLWESDLEAISDLDRQIEALFNTLKISTESVHLLVDFKDKVPSKVTLPFLINALPRLNEWRSLTLSSSSFPENLSDVKRNTIEELERLEWVAWLFVRARQSNAKKRVPTFGDYGINNPVLIDDLDPRIINMSPNIRYTDTLTYVIAKGQAQPRKKKAKTAEQKAARQQLAPSNQYPKLANMIKEHPSWKTGSFSWGDQFVDRCSQHRCIGSPSDWRGVGASHHIAVVVQQLANLP
jgi:hypothetical protein